MTKLYTIPVILSTAQAGWLIEGILPASVLGQPGYSGCVRSEDFGFGGKLAKERESTQRVRCSASGGGSSVGKFSGTMPIDRSSFIIKLDFRSCLF